jgi:hypothetical protein
MPPTSSDTTVVPGPPFASPTSVVTSNTHNNAAIPSTPSSIPTAGGGVSSMASIASPSMAGPTPGSVSSAASSMMGMHSPSPSPRHVPQHTRTSSPHHIAHAASPAPSLSNTGNNAMAMAPGGPSSSSSSSAHHPTPFSPTPVGSVVGSGIEGVPVLAPSMVHQHSAPIAHLPHHAPPILHSSSLSSATTASASASSSSSTGAVNSSSIVLSTGALPCIDPLSSYEVSKLFEARCQSFHEGAYVPYACRGGEPSEFELIADAKDNIVHTSANGGGAGSTASSSSTSSASSSSSSSRDNQRQRQELEGMDMFALGCMISELFTKRPLFTPRTLPLYQEGRYIPDITTLPQPVRALVCKLISINPKDRPSAAYVMTSALQLNFQHYKTLYRFLSQLEKKKATFPLMNRIATTTSIATTSSSSSNVLSSSSSLRAAAPLTITTSLTLPSSTGTTPIPTPSGSSVLSPSPSPQSTLLAPATIASSPSPVGGDSSIDPGSPSILVSISDPTPSPPPPSYAAVMAAAAAGIPTSISVPMTPPRTRSPSSTLRPEGDVTIVPPVTPPPSHTIPTPATTTSQTASAGGAVVTSRGSLSLTAPDPVCVWLLNRLPSLLSLPTPVYHSLSTYSASVLLWVSFVIMLLIGIHPGCTSLY